MPEGRNLRVFFQEAGIRKGVRRGDGILVGILQRAESGYGFSKRVQITNYPFFIYSATSRYVVKPACEPDQQSARDRVYVQGIVWDLYKKF